MKLFKLVLLILALQCLRSFAGSIAFKEGVGITDSINGNIAMFSLAHESEFSKRVLQKIEFGGWGDKAPGHRSSGYGSYSLGIKVHPDMVYAQAFFGLAFITQTDKLLSTNLEFSHDLGIGVEDGGKAIGISIKHLSNAGIKKPNIGRNFIQLEARLFFEGI